MTESMRKSTVLWGLWLAIVPLGLVIVYQLSPPVNIDWTYLATFAVFAVIMTMFPLTINGTSILVAQWLILAVFLKYGLFAEIIAMQLSALAVILRTRSEEPFYIRLPLNSLMFFVASVISGAVFYIYGGEIGSVSLSHIFFFGLLHQLTYFLVNHTFLFVYDRLSGEKPPFITVDSIWDFVVMLVAFPFTIVLYLTESFAGVAALYLIGVPFIAVSFFLRMYSDSERINRDLKKAAEIGHQLAGRMTQEEVLDLFMVRVSELLPAVDYAYLLDYRKSSGKFQLLRNLEEDQFVDLDIPPQDGDKGVAGYVLNSGRPVIYRKRDEWDSLVAGHMAEDAESLMGLPISRNDETEGVLVLASKKKHAFAGHQLKLLDMLASYFAVSLEKAAYMKQAIDRSERCGLTGLYNYRYLNDELERLMSSVNKGELDTLSLVMMDIDHFKSINDRYGHQSGNDILVSVARILQDEVGDEGTIARYGGEEFVVVLPNYGKDLTMLLAERLRQRIEEHGFDIQSDLDESRTLQKVHITMSLGIASAPEDSDDAMGLIRNADRALYIGAKQAGRNKVAAYAK